MSGGGDAPRPARTCPICGKTSTEAAYPFCSRRCADVDLNRWLKGGYVIPGAESRRGEAPEEDPDD